MPVDTGGALGAKARFVLRRSESANELLNGTAPGGTAGTTSSTADGLAYLPAASPTTWQVAIDDLDPAVIGSFSVFWHGYIRSNTSQVLLESVGPSYGWHFGTSSYSGGFIQFYLYSKFSASYRGQLVAIDDNALHSVMMRYNDATGNVEFLLDGTSLGAPDWWIKDATPMNPTLQTFGQNGDGSTPHKTTTVQAFAGLLDSTETSALFADPYTIFTAPAITLVGSNCTQANTSSNAVIGIVGILSGSPCVQGNVGGVGQITRTQTLTAAGSTQANASSTGSIDPYGRLRALLKPVAKYVWTQVNTTRFLDCSVPDSDDNPAYSSLTHEAVAKAWPGFAWDRDNANLLLWGGGHANYAGNEIYIWDGTTGVWNIGSLPSEIDSDGYIPDKSAPQSSHTYSNNVWLSVNKMFCTFGGAASPSGGPFTEIVAPGTPPTNRRVGPWCFDLALANASLVGGSSGTGWDHSSVKAGSNAWYNRIDKITGTYPISTLNHIGCRAIAVVEGGKDVCYFTMDAASGFPYYYRYEFGDIRAGGTDSCAKVGETWDSVVYDGFGVYDPSRGFMYSNSVNASGKTNELSIQRVLGMSGTTHDTAIEVVDTVGSPFVMVRDGFSFGGAYNEDDDLIYLWNGHETNPGTFYTIAIPAWNGTSWASTTWVATEHIPSGSTPRGNYQVSVLGRMRYVPALKAVVVLDSVIVGSDSDAGVWMLKTTDPEFDLTGSTSTQGNVSGTGQITRTQTLGGSNCTQGNASATGVVTVSGTVNLAAAASTQANSSASGSVILGMLLVHSPSVQDNVASVSAIVQTHILAAASATQANLCSTGAWFTGLSPIDAPRGRGPRLRVARSNRPAQLR